MPEGLGVREEFSVEVDHRLHHLGERLRVLPAQVAVGSAAVALEDDRVAVALEVLADRHVLGPVVDADRGERELQEFAELVGLPGGEDVVTWLCGAHHQLHATHIVGRPAPVARHIEVAELEALLLAGGNAGHALGDTSGHETNAAQWGFVVVEDRRRGVHAVICTVLRDEIHRLGLRLGVGAVRRARGRFVLRGYVSLLEDGSGRGLHEPAVARVLGECLQNRPHCSDIDRVGADRVIEGFDDRADAAEVVDLICRSVVERRAKQRRITQVAFDHLNGRRITQEEGRVSARLDEADDFGARGKQVLRQQDAVLSGSAGDESAHSGPRTCLLWRPRGVRCRHRP